MGKIANSNRESPERTLKKTKTTTATKTILTISPCSQTDSLQNYEKTQLFFNFFFFFRSTTVAYGSSQARGRIGAKAAGLHHSNVGSEPHL